MQMGLLPGSLCFPAFEGLRVWHRCSVLRQDFRWMEWVCLQCKLSTRNIRHPHAASHRWYVWPSISLSTVTATTHSGGKCKKIQMAVWKWSVHAGIFFLVTIICQAIYLQNHTSFLGGMAGIHLCDMFLNSLSEFSLSVWTLVKFFLGEKFQPVIGNHVPN